MRSPLRGEIYWIDWSPHRGSEQAGTRPGLVISADAFNREFHVCTALALTTKVKPSMLAVTLPTRVTGEVCQVLPWQIMTISENRLEGLVAVLDSDLMAEVEHSLRVLWRLT
jgi:mRNA interferase MazF